ncbi:hypothetical protein [Anaerobium acetethylicum]|nr:hypothetical protein [Anaerobium acetethylicum]
MGMLAGGSLSPEEAQVCWFVPKDRTAELEKKGEPINLEMPEDQLRLE